MASWTGFKTLFKRETYRFLVVPNNTVVPALVSIFLYLLIFGLSLGNRIRDVGGMSYLQFIVPGLIMLNIITGSYSNPSGSLFMSRWRGFIEDILMSPMSYTQMVTATLLGGVMRGLILGAGAFIISLFFVSPEITSLPIIIAFSVLTAVVFSCIGILVGLWADEWEQLNLFLNFLITPLTFLGGIFYTMEIIPPTLQTITRLNPMFYMIDGFRYGMTGFSDGNIVIGLVMLSALSIILVTLCIQLFRKGWKLRD